MLENFKLECLASVAAQIVFMVDRVLRNADDLPPTLTSEVRSVKLVIDEVRVNARSLSQKTFDERGYVKDACYNPMLEKLNAAVSKLCKLVNGVLNTRDLPSHQEISNSIEVINDLMQDIYEHQW